MEKLFIVFAALMASQAQASNLSSKPIDKLTTSIRCVAKDDASNMSYKQTRLGSITMGDYTFTPKQEGESKSLLVEATLNGEKFEKTLEFGTSGSTAMTLPVRMGDGAIFYCNILMQKDIE